MEAIVQRAAGLAGNRPEAAPGGLRLTHVFRHCPPLVFFSGPAADRVGGERLTQHVGQRL